MEPSCDMEHTSLRSSTPVQPAPARSRAVMEGIAMGWTYDYKDKDDHKKHHGHDHDHDYDKDDYEKDDYEKDYDNGKDKKRRHCS